MYTDADSAVGLLEVSDVSRQNQASVTDIPADVTVSELIESLITDMSLARNDVEGRPLSYQARLEREGRHLRGSERVGESLRTGDRLVLQPNIDAGRGS